MRGTTKNIGMKHSRSSRVYVCFQNLCVNDEIFLIVSFKIFF